MSVAVFLEVFRLFDDIVIYFLINLRRHRRISVLCECHDDLGLHKRLDLHAVCPVGELLLVAELRAISLASSMFLSSGYSNLNFSATFLVRGEKAKIEPFTQRTVGKYLDEIEIPTTEWERELFEEYDEELGLPEGIMLTGVVAKFYY